MPRRRSKKPQDKSSPITGRPIDKERALALRALVLSSLANEQRTSRAKSKGSSEDSTSHESFDFADQLQRFVDTAFAGKVYRLATQLVIAEFEIDGRRVAEDLRHALGERANTASSDRLQNAVKTVVDRAALSARGDRDASRAEAAVEAWATLIREVLGRELDVERIEAGLRDETLAGVEPCEVGPLNSLERFCDACGSRRTHFVVISFAHPGSSGWIGSYRRLWQCGTCRRETNFVERPSP